MEQYVMKDQKRLRMGVTTGTCAAAAAEAAASLLLMGIRKEAVLVHTPKGIAVTVPVSFVLETEKKAQYKVRKDSGDDPDVTNHAEIYASVEKIAENTEIMPEFFTDIRYPGLFLEGGKGVGRVTKEGLEQKVGQAAINKIPRSMIFQAVGEICRLAEYNGRLLIMIEIPEGWELAERTFNPRLGIKGGISVLGTSGILEPMSERAVIDTIETQIRQLKMQGISSLLVTPGNYGQSYISDYFHLDVQQSIKCSNYIGETLDLAVSYGMKNFLLIGNIGKLVKLAAGIMNTHSRTADGRCEIFAVHTVLCGGTLAMVREIMECINTEEILNRLERWGIKEAVIKSLCRKIEEHVERRGGSSIQCGVVLFSEKMGLLGETQNVKRMLEDYR